MKKSSRGVSYFAARAATRGAMLALTLWTALPSGAVAQDRAVLQVEPDTEVRLRRWLEVRAERSGRRCGHSPGWAHGV